MANFKFQIHKIQAGLGLSINRFMQLRDDIRQKVEAKGLTTTRFAIDDIRQNVQTIVHTIISKFKKKIISTDKKFV